MIVGDLGDDFGYPVLNCAFRHVMAGAELIALQQKPLLAAGRRAVARRRAVRGCARVRDRARGLRGRQAGACLLRRGASRRGLRRGMPPPWSATTSRRTSAGGRRGPGRGAGANRQVPGRCCRRVGDRADGHGRLDWRTCPSSWGGDCCGSLGSWRLEFPGARGGIPGRIRVADQEVDGHEERHEGQQRDHAERVVVCVPCWARVLTRATIMARSTPTRRPADGDARRSLCAGWVHVLR